MTAMSKSERTGHCHNLTHLVKGGNFIAMHVLSPTAGNLVTPVNVTDVDVAIVGAGPYGMSIGEISNPYQLFVARCRISRPATSAAHS